MSNSLYGGIIELSANGQIITPDIVLAYRNGDKKGVISNVQALIMSNHLMNANEISFDVYKTVDEIECSLWDDIKDLRLLYIPHFDNTKNNPWYELSVTVDESDATVKHCVGVHVQESELSQLLLNDIQINTTEDINREDYDKDYPTIMYRPDMPEASLLHRLLKDKASHYYIQHVDASIASVQRTFSFDGITIKDALNEIAEEIECIFVFGEHDNNDKQLHRSISVYDLNDYCSDCGERGSFTNGICSKCGSSDIIPGYGYNSGIFLSKENFLNDITYSSNKDEIKNCFRLVAGDDLMTATIRNINPSGSQYIWHISDSTKADMSPALQNKLTEYDALYNNYETSQQLGVTSDIVNRYNALINKYKTYDNNLSVVEYPVVGYSALIDFYYSALNLHSLLQTSLAPASQIGSPTTAAEQIEKLTSEVLSPLGVQNSVGISATTVTSALTNYAKVFIDTSLYKVSAVNSTFSNGIWTGFVTLTSYYDDEDFATTPLLSIEVTDVSAEYLKCQLEKAMKKNNVDATGVVELFKKNEAEFKSSLSFYSVDNLGILANIARACLDILIQQGAADPISEMYEAIYEPYYNKSSWIQAELKERELEVLSLRGNADSPLGVLDTIEIVRQKIANTLNLQTYLGDTLWAELCSFRREDTYQNENCVSDGLTDNELITKAQEFFKKAEKAIMDASALQHTISCNLNNLLLIKESEAINSNASVLENVNVEVHGQTYAVRTDNLLSPLLEYFENGNWLHINIDDIVYRLRLTDYTINFDNMKILEVEFSDVTYGLGYLADTQSILMKANSMATSYNATKKNASSGRVANNQLNDIAKNGLNLTNKRIVNSADNQSLLVDETGMLMRSKFDDTDEYSLEQVKVINHGFYYTTDAWRTVKTGLGKFVYFDPETGTYKEDYGLIANKIVGNIILGNEVGIYNTSGSVRIDDDGFTITADPNDTNENLFRVRRKNPDGSFTNYIYVSDDGHIKLNGSHIQMSTGSLESYVEEAIKEEASALIVQLSSDNIGIPTNALGGRDDYSNYYVDGFAFLGSTDITNSAEIEWIVTATGGISGVWDDTNHRYTISNLTSDIGDIIFSVSHVNGLSVEKVCRVSKIKEGASGQPGIDGSSSYFHVKYSNDGETFTSNDGEVLGDWIGICVNDTKDDPPEFDDYEWKKIKGNDGENGIPGKDGTNGKTTYFHVKYAPVENPTEAQMTDIPSKYIGTYVDYEYEDSDDPAKYTWSQFIGNDGADGIPGKNGTNGETSYLHIAYANNSTGTSGFSVSDSKGKLYIGQCTDFDKNDQTDPSKYLWTKIKGEDGTDGKDGVDGKDGIDGVDGTDGKSSYFFVKFSKNANGNPMTETPNADTKYMGTCASDSPTAPTSYSAYTWAKVRGEDGGDGKGISLITNYYLATSASSGVTRGTPGWNTAIQSMTVDKRYLWNYEVIKYTDNSSEPTDPIIIGVYGETGTEGQRGTGILKITTAPSSYTTAVGGVSPKYRIALSTVKTQSSVSEVVVGDVIQYSYYQYPIIYVDASYVYTGTRTSIRGSQGATGNGIASIVEYYKTSNSSTTPPTSWDTAPSQMTENERYLWNYEVITYTNGDIVDTAKRVIGAYGKKGEPGVGIDGKTTYFHVRYSNDGETFTANNGKELGDWIGTCTNFEEYGPKEFDDYDWQKIKGEAGTLTIRAESPNERNYPSPQWATYGAPGYSGTWSSITNASSYRVGDIMAVTGKVSDKGGISCVLYATVTNVAGDSVVATTISCIYGSQGDKGEDGKTEYLHIKYSDDGETFTANNGEIVGAWIGTYVSSEPTDDSPDWDDYTWKKFTGDVNVGGRNLIKDSNDIILTSNQESFVTTDHMKVTVTSDTSDTTYTYVQVSNYIWHPDEGRNKLFSIDISELAGEVGLEYTFSVDVKYTNCPSEFPIWFVIRNSSETNMATSGYMHPDYTKEGEWQRLSSTFKINSLGADRAKIAIGASKFGTPYGATVEYKNFKLERGNIATDWSAAPEDIDDDINNKANNVLEEVAKKYTTKADVKVLEDAIKSFVIEDSETGTLSTLLEQTANGWTYNFSSTTRALKTAQDTLGKLGETVGDFAEGETISGIINNIDGVLDDIKTRTAYIDMKTMNVNGESVPYIELGKRDTEEGEKAFKVRITNSAMTFYYGASTPLRLEVDEYGESYVVADRIVTEEITQGAGIWIIHGNTRKNLGLAIIN